MPARSRYIQWSSLLRGRERSEIENRMPLLSIRQHGLLENGEGELPAHIHKAIECFARTAWVKLRHLCGEVVDCNHGSHCIGHFGYLVGYTQRTERGEVSSHEKEEGSER